MAETATMLDQGRSLLEDGNRWFVVSLILYLALSALVRRVFLPRGKAVRDRDGRGSTGGWRRRQDSNL